MHVSGVKNTGSPSLKNSIRANINASRFYAKAEKVSVLQGALHIQDNLQLALAFFCPFNAMQNLNVTL